MAETLRQRIEALRDDIGSTSFHAWLEGSYVTWRLTAALALPDGPTDCTDCPRCGDHVRTSDLRQWQVCEQTHMEPAEYEDGCINCCPREEQ